MNFDKATNEQLWNIARYDADCPTHLLSGIVRELLNRNWFDGLIKSVLIRNFKSINIAADVLKTEEEDLFQYCRTFVYEALNKYKSGLSSFVYFAYRYVGTCLNDLEKKVKAEKRKVYEHIQSTDKLLNEEGETYIQTIRSSTNVEVYVIKKITMEEKLKPLTKDEKEAFLLYLKGLCFSEIAKVVHISKSGVDRRINRALEKIFGRKIKLKELGIRNDKGRVIA